MVKQEYIDKLVNIQGFSIKNLFYIDTEDHKELIIELDRTQRRYQCSCGRTYTAYYDGKYRKVRDFSYGPHKKTWLLFYQCRIDCDTCGIKTEYLEWVEPRAHYTVRLAAAVALSCEETRDLTSIAKQYDLHWETVKDIDKKALEQKLPELGDTEATLLAVDEFSIKKRHRYGTTVIDAERGDIIYVGKDRSEYSLVDLYTKMGTERCARIRAVAMDMWKPYEKATREHCPYAMIVYDPFHIIQAYGRDVIDRVRVAEYGKASAHSREVIKGSRYLLLKNRENLDAARGEQVTLKKLLALNTRLEKVYLLKDDLKQLWRYKSEAWATKWFAAWYRRAMYSKITPLKLFARKLKTHSSGILAHCKYPIHTGMIEGINNKIKVIKRVAYGFRDIDYFFLKIRGAFCSTHTKA